MKAAVVTPFMPWPADTGGKLRSFHLLRGLAERADVDLFTVHYGEQPPEPGPLTEMCARVESIQLQRRWSRYEPYRRTLRSLPRLLQHFHTAQSLLYLQSELLCGYDLVVCDELAMWPYVAHLPRVGVPLVSILHKIDWMHYRELAQARPWGVDKVLDWVESVKLKRMLRQVAPFFNGAVVCSPEDEALLKDLYADVPTRVIINGADTDFFTPAQRQPADEPTIMFMGTMSYYPNIDAVRYFFDEMYALLQSRVPNVRILIVGQNPVPDIRALEKQYANVIVTGKVPDVRPYLAQSHVLMVPLRLGGGTRLKIVEAMAAGVPVVSTSVGAQGLLDVAEEGALVLADTPHDFVEALVRLLQAPAEEITEMTRKARRIAEERYSWRKLGADFADFCFEVAQHAKQQVRTHV
ncbi:MAG: glycosyltransferase [Ardenticatenia bacterium]|nr:MAG: glycosyltransferase [Ardenticatenia bacterium]